MQTAVFRDTMINALFCQQIQTVLIKVSPRYLKLSVSSHTEDTGSHWSAVFQSYLTNWSTSMTANQVSWCTERQQMWRHIICPLTSLLVRRPSTPVIWITKRRPVLLSCGVLLKFSWEVNTITQNIIAYRMVSYRNSNLCRPDWYHCWWFDWLLQIISAYLRSVLTC